MVFGVCEFGGNKTFGNKLEFVAGAHANQFGGLSFTRLVRDIMASQHDITLPPDAEAH